MLSGDVELNPGMTNGNGNDTRTKTKRKQRSGNIAHLNVRSLKNKEHFILAKDLAKKHKLDIFTISESWLNESVSDLEVEFPGFSLFRLDRTYKIGGGVCVFVNNSLKMRKICRLITHIEHWTTPAMVEGTSRELQVIYCLYSLSYRSCTRHLL